MNAKIPPYVHRNVWTQKEVTRVLVTMDINLKMKKTVKT